MDVVTQDDAIPSAEDSIVTGARTNGALRMLCTAAKNGMVKETRLDVCGINGNRDHMVSFVSVRMRLAVRFLMDLEALRRSSTIHERDLRG